VGKRKNEQLTEALEKAESIYHDYFRNKPFDFKTFTQIFREGTNEVTVFEFFDRIIKQMKMKNRAGNAMFYRDVKNVVLNFTETKDIYFPDIDYRWLDSFESWCIDRGCTGGGIAAYMRCIRALFNKAIKHDVVDQKYYPFSSQLNRKGYSFAHLKTPTNYRALSVEDLGLFKDYQPEEDEQLAYHLFMFSYYTFGTNFTDLAHVKWENIKDNHLIYYRKKTKGAIVVPLRKEAMEIIKHFRENAAYYKERYLMGHSSEYVFPILSDYHAGKGMKTKDRIKKVLAKTNKYLKGIAAKLEIDQKVTFYVARHSAATIAKKKGASVEEISDLLGHANPVITQVYLAKFSGQELSKTVDLL
jgi:integrase/recombinase XerD